MSGTYPSPDLYPGPDVWPWPPERVGPKPDLPHFAYPFRFVGTSAVVTEQDSAEEIMDCARAVLLCPLGFRTELPGFGVADQTFANAPDRNAMEGALSEWEPRAMAIVETERDAFDELVSNVTVRVAPQSED